MSVQQLRLGAVRRNRRDYSVKQRLAGLNAGDRILERHWASRAKKALMLAFLNESTAQTEIEKDDTENFKFLAVLASRQTKLLRTPRLIEPQYIPRKNISLDSFHEQECDELFGFTKHDIRRMFDSMQIPQSFKLNADRHEFSVDGMHGFLYTLFRFRSPSTRMTLDTERFGFDYSVLSKLFTVVVDYIHLTHKHRLRNVEGVVHRFPEFNRVIKDNIRTHFNVIPDDAQYCALFGDACRLRVSRPSGEYWMQRAVYSGHKHYHNIALQGIFSPDGVFVDWFEGPVGKYGDGRVMRDSDFNAKLRNVQLHNVHQYWVYLDKGYEVASHVRSAAHGPAPVSALQHRDNGIMSRERIAVEWGFAKVQSRCPYITQPRLLRLREADVSQRVAVAVLLTNAHTCMHQSQTGLYFNCMAPTLETYFA